VRFARKRAAATHEEEADMGVAKTAVKVKTRKARKKVKKATKKVKKSLK
jgi:hypothetical protein